MYAVQIRPKPPSIFLDGGFVVLDCLLIDPSIFVQIGISFLDGFGRIWTAVLWY